jgi:hypothetical protein
MVSILERWEIYKEMDFSYQFVIGLVSILLVFSVVFFVFVILSRIVKNRRKRIYEKYQAIFENILTELVFDEELTRDSDKYQKQLKEVKLLWNDNNVKRAALVDTLMEMMVSFAGPLAVRISEIYSDLNLDSQAAQNLRKNSWYYQVKGLKELRVFKVYDRLGEIIGLTNNKNRLVREEAQIASIEIGETEALSFILDLSENISPWQQLRLLERLKQMDRDKIPEFISFLVSNNRSVLVFILKLISYFNQVSATEKVAELVNHPEPSVQEQAIKVLVKNFSIEYFDLIKSRFELKEKSVQLEVIKAIGVLGDEDDVKLLETIFDIGDFDLSLEAARTIVELGYDDYLKSIQNKYGESTKEIIKHALHERC